MELAGVKRFFSFLFCFAGKVILQGKGPRRRIQAIRAGTGEGKPAHLVVKDTHQQSHLVAQLATVVILHGRLPVFFVYRVGHGIKGKFRWSRCGLLCIRFQDFPLHHMPRGRTKTKTDRIPHFLEGSRSARGSKAAAIQTTSPGSETAVHDYDELRLRIVFLHS